MNGRGALIGQIIDDLERVCNQTEVRGANGLQDIHRHVETVFLQILSIAYDCALVNLNEERSNAPGLDLGDKSKKIAFQITADNSGRKVNKTLEKTTDKQLEEYEKIYIFTVVKRQGKYTALNQSLQKRCHEFTQQQILDYRDVVSTLLGKDFDSIHRVQQILQKETQRVLMELQVPNREGKFTSSIAGRIEGIPSPQIGDGKAFEKYYVDQSLDSPDIDIIVEELTALSKRLARLPRVTREFFLQAIIHADFESNFSGDVYKISEAVLKRRFRNVPDYEGELEILLEEQFLTYSEAEQYENTPAYFNFSEPVLSEISLPDILDFLEKEKISKDKVFVALDFGDF